MEEEEPLRRSSAVWLPTVSSSFVIPFTRYATRLIAFERQRSLLAAQSAFGDLDDDYYRRCVIGVDSAYSKPILILDAVWNLAFVLVSVVVLFWTFRERPSTPLRLWLSGYTLQCLLHVGAVFFQYWRMNFWYDFVYEDRGAQNGLFFSQSRGRITKNAETLNTTISIVWWLFGFYCIVMGGQALLQDAPRLYWLTVIFLAFDVFFILFCIGVACVVFFVLCFCIPALAFVYALMKREGASEDDINTLPKYRFRQAKYSGTLNFDMKPEVIGAMKLNSRNNTHMNELALPPEDSECCICLSQYEEGTELYTLPCKHHFHCNCVGKWLRINATCPLCKFNILRGEADSLV